MIRPRTLADHIRETDRRLVLNAARLAKYLRSGTPDAVTVQRGVIDRLLDARLLLMADRDRN